MLNTGVKFPPGWKLRVTTKIEDTWDEYFVQKETEQGNSRATRANEKIY